MGEVEEFKVEKSKEEGTTIANKKSGPEDRNRSEFEVKSGLTDTFNRCGSYCTVRLTLALADVLPDVPVTTRFVVPVTVMLSVPLCEAAV